MTRSPDCPRRPVPPPHSICFFRSLLRSPVLKPAESLTFLISLDFCSPCHLYSSRPGLTVLPPPGPAGCAGARCSAGSSTPAPALLKLPGGLHFPWHRPAAVLSPAVWASLP